MSEKTAGAVRITDLRPEQRTWAGALIRERWASVKVVTRGRVHDTTALPGFVAFLGDAPAGLLTYRLEGDECEIVTLDSLREQKGVGTALIDSVKARAEASGCGRLWLITTNDNLAALRFYQKRGFSLAALNRNALDESRRLKPEIPPTGIDGIPIRDEIELEIRLSV
jgi:ribosomal protein S18 acetylase RimI-like enzyme